MIKNWLRGIGWREKEIVFQMVLHILVFVFYAYDRREIVIQEYEIAFFLSYAIAGFFINYLLLPRFYYQKKYWQFFLSIVMTVAVLILVEELFLEQIYFPDTRGTNFPGLFSTLLGILPVLTILTGFKFAWDALGKQHEVEKLTALAKETELQFLKSQINPHFLFNNLNNLYSYALENSPKTSEIIVELSSVLRYMLYECQADFVSLEKEIKQLENYISLSEMQIEERGKVHFSTENINPNIQIAPLILIGFVENAFKHSTASQSENILIDIRVELKENTLHFNCRNSFLEQSNTQNLSKGIGLENIKKRLALIYPKDTYELNIDKLENIFEVKLKINLKSIGQTANRKS